MSSEKRFTLTDDAARIINDFMRDAEATDLSDAINRFIVTSHDMLTEYDYDLPAVSHMPSAYGLNKYRKFCKANEMKVSTGLSEILIKYDHYKWMTDNLTQQVKDLRATNNMRQLTIEHLEDKLDKYILE